MTRTICKECCDWYEYEIGTESSEHCPKCLFAEAGAGDEEIKDLQEQIDAANADLDEAEADNSELIKERDALAQKVDDLDNVITDLRADLEKARAAEPKLISIKLGAGIVEVLQLDDPEIRKLLGIDWECVGKGQKQILVRGTSEALGRLLCVCLSRARGKQGGWDQPDRYARSAHAAAERLEAVL